jgi:hypothetical protein
VLLDARQQLPPEKRGWNGVRLAFHRDGTFELHYDYPK